MPIYEYRCASCGEEHEVLQKISDPPLTDCPSCRQPSLRKLVSVAGFQLKGSGWYVTDFRNNAASGGKGKAHRDEAKAGADSKGKEAAASDTTCGAGACPACE
ncbi:MAG TPA: FmdB family zinc ribbon protein [Burkholderiales bacterium]|jgi:putative FmdB family regulatory protein|nr:FmdB family zinc ribbon protein [Burkholderiales bacterium]